MKAFFVGEAAEQEGKVVTSYFLLSAKQRRMRKSGQDYLTLVLADRTGSIPAKVWEAVDSFHDVEVNDIVKIQGRVIRYLDRLEITVAKGRRAEESEFNLADFLLMTSKNIDELWAELARFVASVADDRLREVLQILFNDDRQLQEQLRRAPAAKSYHHACMGGLLDHVTSLCRLCDLAQRNYPWLNRDLLIAGALLHDIGKVHELAYERAIDYTDEGKLRGHIAMGVELLRLAMVQVGVSRRLEAVLEHLILSHHGLLEYGSPVEPACAEAYMLHFLDNIDSKMEAMRCALEEPNGSEQWSRPVASLRKPILRVASYLQTPKS